jgi:hypothetical protein
LPSLISRPPKKLIIVSARPDRARSRAVRNDRRTRCRGQHAQELEADIAQLLSSLAHHTKTRSPQTNGICERSQKTAANEFPPCITHRRVAAGSGSWIKAQCRRAAPLRRGAKRRRRRPSDHLSCRNVFFQNCPRDQGSEFTSTSMMYSPLRSLRRFRAAANALPPA